MRTSRHYLLISALLAGLAVAPARAADYGSAVEAYTSLPPIITVAPGASITVMVDRDLEFW